jgi:hypothetical protein
VHTDLQRNVVYCLTHASALKNLSSKTLASTLHINISTLSRWKSYLVEPRDEHVSHLAIFLSVDKSIFYLAHDEFVGILARHKPIITDFNTKTPRVEFGSIEKWRHLWGECEKKHRGSYILYSRVLSSPGKVAKSLLRIREKSDRGISFDIFNVDDRYSPANPTIYKYDGLVFPIYECLSFYAEEDSRNEPISMVTSSSQVATPTILTGYLVAVAVTPEMRKPSGTKIALTFRTKNIIDPLPLLKELGIRSRDQISILIQQLLFE